MKKIFLMILSAFLVLGLASCQKEPLPEAENNESSAEKEDSVPKEDLPAINGWTADFEPSDFDSPEEYDEAFLDAWAESLEPIEIFDTKTEYPFVIKEIFEILIEKDEYYTGAFIKNISVCGDEKEFFVNYSFIGETGKNRGIDTEASIAVRIRRTEDGKYALVARGGGPLAQGLEESSLTFGEVWQEKEKDYETAMNEWLEGLAPLEIFDTKNVYPKVIGEIFGIMMENEPDEQKAAKIKMIEVFGGENEFFVQYRYSSEKSEFGNLRIRVRINNDGIYTLVAEGDGPLYYGLEKDNITLSEAGFE